MPEARGDIREIIGEPVFIPLFKLFLAYGPVFKLSFGPKTFVIVSDPALAKQVGSHGNAALRKRPACLIPCTLVVASAVARRRHVYWGATSGPACFPLQRCSGNSSRLPQAG